MRPDMKNDRYEILNRFEFCLCLHERVILGRPVNSCILLVHFENKYGREKKDWKTSIIDRYFKCITTYRFLHNQYYLQIGYVID